MPAVNMHGPCQYACPAVNTPVLLSIRLVPVNTLLVDTAAPSSIRLSGCQYAHPAVVVVICGAGDEVAGCIGS